MTEVKNYLISQPVDWMEAFRAKAESEGMSLSAWIGESCKAQLSTRQQQQLPERPKSGPKSKGN